MPSVRISSKSDHADFHRHCICAAGWAKLRAAAASDKIQTVSSDEFARAPSGFQRVKFNCLSKYAVHTRAF
jgi:hypothetical protein